jgi:hypothetical protein
MFRSDKSTAELRKFGLTIGLAFGVLSAFLWWRNRPSFAVFGGIAAGLLATSLLFPRVLGPIELIWMRVAHVMGAIVTRVLLFATYFLLITPMGLLMRLFGKDSLQVRAEPTRQSFWIEVENDGPCARPEKPY